MKAITRQVAEILEDYEGEPPGVKANLYRILMHGRLGGTGKLVILPVDQGFEHGPARSFASNPAAYDPLYHYKLAIEAGCSAYAAPLGSLSAGSETFAGQIPTILKYNNANALDSGRRDTNQAVTASVQDALRLGCSAVGFTIYPGSDNQYEMFEEVRDMISQARAVGLPSVVWSYPRGGNLSQAGETALDVIGCAAHMACLLGAHIVKVKLPSGHLEQPEAAKAFKAAGIPMETQADRVREIVRSSFAGRRIVVFSGGAAKGLEGVFDDARAIKEGGGNGSIIGRNSFQRPFDDAVKMLGDIMEIYED